MDIDTFDYILPEHLIAQYPTAKRTGGRLLHIDPSAGRLDDLMFSRIGELLAPGDLLVLNDSRVIPARLRAQKPTGGRAEILIERVLDETGVRAQIRGARNIRPGQRLKLENGMIVIVTDRCEDLFEIRFPSGKPAAAMLDVIGHVPLPPYIKRADEAIDRERYQTVYAAAPGSVAAPTAGLHFDKPLLAAISDRGVKTVFVTLQVGLATFAPVRVRDPRQHRMHSEQIIVSPSVCRAINNARTSGRRVVAVGTTTTRALESVATPFGDVAPYKGETDLFILPGYRFRVVDALITNFHLPRSTLLMMVCAFGGTDTVMAAYRHAVNQGYRFYSYGDAMFVQASRS